MIADPESQIFVDHANSNFHLLQNAQAVDAGTNLVLPTVFEDLDNISRPQGSGFDLGCYEYNTITSVEQNDLPSEFILFQNYPNPFNPSTKIKFTIPSVETTRRVVFTTLKVYDILGNEVAVLVDEYKPAGKYELTYYANNYPSGVYFYQLRVGNFVNTKSMVLIK
jgi:hypothetical protein